MGEIHEVVLRGRLTAITARDSAATLGQGTEIGVDVGVALARAMKEAGITEYDGECTIVVHLLSPAGTDS